MSAELVGGRYRLGRPLGAGGMGQVWEAEDTVLRRAVAVKAVDLPPHLDEDDRQSLRTRVLREARSAAAIDHPSSVRVFDVVDDGNRIHVVMELVRAPTLAAVVSQSGPLEPQRAAAVGLGVLGALEAAHRAGIVHRDVKPANVMMLDDGGVKLADFGIASAKDDTRITAVGLVLGTPSYMAPEQAAGRPTGASADLWGLGALLYYAVEGVPPFDRGQALPTLNAVLHDDPRPMTRADGLEPVVQALLVKAPENRSTAAQSRAALERLARSEAPATTMANSGAGATAVLPAGAGVAETARPAGEAPGAGAGEAAVRTGGDRRDRRPPPPGGGTGFGPPAGGGLGSGRSWLVGLGVVALVAVVAGLVLASAGNDGSTTTAPSPPATAVEETSPQADPGAGDDAASPTTASNGQQPTATAADPDRADGGRPPGVPGDWVLHTDRATGYTIWRPPAWEPRGGPGSATDFVDPATGDYLRVDYVSSPGDDPVEAWEASSQSFAARYDDYQEIAIEGTEYQGFDAALWEYTYSGQHATNLGFVTDNYGFALNFQTAETRWQERQGIRQAFEAGFRVPGADDD